MVIGSVCDEISVIRKEVVDISIKFLLVFYMVFIYLIKGKIWL